jgi:hypothetical protein
MSKYNMCGKCEYCGIIISIQYPNHHWCHKLQKAIDKNEDTGECAEFKLVKTERWDKP